MKGSDYPAIYLAADKASIDAQSWYYRFLKIYSALLIIAAGLGVYGIDDKSAAIAAALVIIASIFVSVVMLLRHDEEVWYRARAVAESVKTSTWRFIMRGDPYLDAENVEAVKSQFRQRLKRILNEHRDLSHHLGGDLSNKEQITAHMCEVRALSWSERADYYRTQRIDEQRSWYANKSSYNKKRGALWFGVLIACQALAVLFVVLRVAYPNWGHWPSEVFLVAAGSALTWIQGKRFRELASAYALTAHELGVIRGELEAVKEEDGFAQFVIDSESAFSREHTQWLARKDVL